MKILVTGGYGFLGSTLLEHLRTLDGISIIGSVRKLKINDFNSNDYVEVGNIDYETDWTSCLKAVDVVIHTAALVHIKNNESLVLTEEYRKVNYLATLNLARQAEYQGVKRFIFISTIKVNGNITTDGVGFTASDIPSPSDVYSISKMEAEQCLLKLAREGKMDVVIIRPPLIYGKGVKANFSALVRLIKFPVPFPFDNIKNERSFVNILNLIDFIVICLSHEKAKNEIFLISDNHDISTTDLIYKLAEILEIKLYMFYLNHIFLKYILILFGKNNIWESLFCSLKIDISKNKQLLNWKPKFSMSQGLIDLCKY